MFLSNRDCPNRPTGVDGSATLGATTLPCGAWVGGG